jgi:hypothetical protein
MKSTVIIAGVLFLFLLVPAAHSGLIDSFDSTPTQSLLLNVPTIALDGNTVTGTGILGGERDATLTWDSGGHFFSLDVNYASSGDLEFSQGANGKSKALLVWDGTDSSYSLPPSSMSPPADLTDSGASTGLAIDVPFDDLPTNLNITLYTTAGTGSATIALPGGITSSQTFYVPFSTFSGTINAAGVTAVSLEIDGTKSAGADVTLDNFRSTVPEPASWLLLGIAAAAGLGVRRWKK